MSQPVTTLHLRTASAAALQAAAPPALQWLSAPEQARLAEITAPRRAAQFVAGRWLARELLAAVHGGQPAGWTLDARADHPPAVTGHPDLHLSIAHSGDAVACALAGLPVGIDVEGIAPRRRLADLLRAITTPEELAALGDLDDLDDNLAREVWTLKEAWIKCAGGELFATMLGHGVRVRPAPAESANGWTWHDADKIIAVVSNVAGLRMAPGTPPPARTWLVLPSSPAAGSLHPSQPPDSP
jgi:4'-phosphopantetheinyl transferase